MTSSHKPTLVLELNDIRDLFVAPDHNLLSSNEVEILGQPGILRVLYRLKPRSLSTSMRLVLLLPSEKIHPDLEQQVRTGITRFCILKVEDNQSKLRLLRRLWWRSTLHGVLFLSLCLALSHLFGSDWLPLSPFFQSLLTEGLMIIGWVGLWHPVETLLYDWIPIVRENSVYHLLQTMTIDILPQTVKAGL